MKDNSNVFNWTNEVNIFEKKYLIIPINENYHWKLAIVCLNQTENDLEVKNADSLKPKNLILFFDSMSTNCDLAANRITKYDSLNELN